VIFAAPLVVERRWEQREERRAEPRFLTVGYGQHGVALF